MNTNQPLYAVYNPHSGFWCVRGEVWHSQHLGLAYAQARHAREMTGWGGWEVCTIAPDGRPLHLEEEIRE